ncbi:unnamed protein product [Didymodactylos carnosus]|uniref:G-protein coupled receptors family 1 profile domain-containing protein n=1 Tax=Didymodactylos carnosus TaxID=1234261 RepID=A0A816BJJ7_9BILA|nr:unnamed protein product [Didymodactylos carnosus]CAF1611636.1 unnamed protein product [Didymodactylos carnosus]CAF4322709.1 unnamed protein product [Didymodactylos carnosus]CAF4494760.1 unnamed protein product [Didymodactylos carnosus]
MPLWSPPVKSAAWNRAEFIVAGILPVSLVVFGTISNLLSVTILATKESRKSSTNIYLIFLCIVDTLSLYQWNLDYAVAEFTGLQISQRSLFLCKSIEFLGNYTFHASASLLTMVSVDRALLLWSLQYKRKIAKPEIALIICIFIFVILFILNGYLLGLGYERTVSNGTPTILQCYQSQDRNDSMHSINSDQTGKCPANSSVKF